MRFVIDCSVALKWVVDEAGSDEAARLLGGELLAPDFLYTECANALWKLEQRGEVSAERAAFKLAALRQVRTQVISTTILVSRALDMACLLQHPVYDCLYLAAAEMFFGRVVSVDTRLLRRVAEGSLSNLAISLEDAAAN